MTRALPTSMKAAVLRRPGDGLAVELIPVPRPKTGEVLVRTTACGLCHSDLHVINGAIAFPTPAVLGHEVSGEIVEIGPGNESYSFKVGDRVAGAFLMPCGSCPDCAAGRDDLCGPFFELNRLKGQLFDGTSRLATSDGQVIAQYSMAGLAEYCVIPSTSVAVLPDSIDPVAGAILGCAAMTAYGAVRRAADLRYGESIAIVGVGGVGQNIIQIAKEFGADPLIAVDIHDEKLNAAVALGATHAVNSRTQDARAVIGEITGGRGVDVAIEALGLPQTFTQALTFVGDGGRMVQVGLAAGAQSAEVPINQTVRRSIRIIGSYGAHTRSDLPQVISMAAKGVIRYSDVVTKRVPLAKAAETYELLERGEIGGRAVVDFSLN